MEAAALQGICVIFLGSSFGRYSFGLVCMQLREASLTYKIVTSAFRAGARNGSHPRAGGRPRLGESSSDKGVSSAWACGPQAHLCGSVSFSVNWPHIY